MIEWRPVKGYEGLYEVSNLGQVRSLNYNHTGEVKILKLSKYKSGYLKVSLHKNGKQYQKTVHRLVAQAFIPNPGDKTEVNHIDGEKQNNTVDNLEWVTASENTKHAWKTGLSKMTEDRKKKVSEANKGSKHPQAKRVICITTGEIFNYIREGAKKYNVANQDISKCCKGKIKSAGKHPATGEKLVWRYI